MGDQLKSNNLALQTTRQYLNMKLIADMLTAQEEIGLPMHLSYPARNLDVVDSSTQTSLFSLLERGRLVEMPLSADGKGDIYIPRYISYPARNLDVADSSTQTSLFSLLERGQLVEMTLSAVGKGANVGPTAAMASSTVEQTNSTSVGKPSTSKGKRVVSVDSAGRVVTIGASSSPSEPLCKKLKLQQTEPKVQRPSTNSSVCQNTNKQTVKSNDDLMTNRHSKNIPKIFLINKKFVLQSAFKDWKNSFVPDEDGNFPLHNAVIDEDLNQVKRQCLVLKARKESVDIQNAEKQTPLHLAVLLGFPQIVQNLLKFGARPEIVDCKGNNALHLAVEKTDNFACLQILLNECNCEPFINTLNHDGFSPLHLCAIAGKCEESLALIEKGADTNLRDAKSGGTALFHAIRAGNFDVSNLLVRNGASAHVPNYAGQTPMSLSVYWWE